MSYFVNLPVSWVVRNPAWLDWFLDAGVAPELGMDSVALGLPLAWHGNAARRLHEAGLTAAVHLPFLGLRPGSPRAGEREKAWDAQRKAADLAGLYGARHMIGHHGFMAREDGLNESPSEPDPAWVNRMSALWRELPERSGAPLFLENSHEHGPHIVLALIKAIGSEQVGICFDVGHWHAFAQGHVRKDLSAWISAFAPYLRHLHLHDNDGTGDQHLGLGQGRIPFARLLDLLSAHTLKPGITFEPHTAEDFLATAAWFAANPGPAAILEWREPRKTALKPPGKHPSSPLP